MMSGLFWLWDELTDFWVDGWMWIFETILYGFVVVLEVIPVPDWALNVGSLQLPSAVAWFAGAFELPFGIAVMTSAWLIRFLIRRIPVIG
ncbi:MAG TPA: hypothetical protein EYQ00_06440 [Dehalococcoidia bacterium]|nr:hypothetical protein [Dehalococcoidia bacterium]